jgi:hypothetical protein
MRCCRAWPGGVAVDGEQAVDALVDLRQLRSLQQLGNDAIRPLLAALKRGELQRLVLDFEDGLQFQLDAPALAVLEEAAPASRLIGLGRAGRIRFPSKRL